MTDAAELRQHAVPDVVVSDLHLKAGADGLDTMKHLRAQPGWESVAMVLLTGDLDGAVAARVEAEGIALAYKPIQPQRLLGLVDRLGTPAPRSDTQGVVEAA